MCQYSHAIMLVISVCSLKFYLAGLTTTMIAHGCIHDQMPDLTCQSHGSTCWHLIVLLATEMMEDSSQTNT